MRYWLIKTEPEEWSWNQQVKSGNRGIEWSGVRNFQASKNLKNMKIGDECFFYHTGKEKQIVGIVEVIKEHYPDPTDKSKRFVAVDIITKLTLPNPVTLEQIKKEKMLSNLLLIKQSRLSVMPIDKKSWHIICKMGGVVI